MTIIYRHIGAPTLAEKKQLEEDMKAARALNSTALEDFTKLATEDEVKALLAELNTAREAYGKKRSGLLKASRAATTPEESAVVLARARDELQPLVVTLRRRPSTPSGSARRPNPGRRPNTIRATSVSARRC